jgi:spermidine/putrescine transport system substrate-binding protein
MISRLIGEGMLEKLDFSNIPNYSMIDDKYKKLEYDPSGEYSVPYMTGVTGIIYNSAMISDTITSWDALFDSKYTGQILMIDNPRDAFAIALLDLGYSVNTTDAGELNKAYELLVSQKPLVQAYVNDQIYDKLESGEAAIGTYYAGDYLAMKENNPDLRFVVPDEGANRFVDAMCILKGAANKTNAELFINFMCKTDICLINIAQTYYTPVNKEAAKEYAQSIDAETGAITFPSDDILSRCQIYINLPADTLKLYDELWVKLKS